MKINDATEVAYKNGYEQGYKDAMNAVLDNYNKFNMSIPKLIEMLQSQKR